MENSFGNEPSIFKVFVQYEGGRMEGKQSFTEADQADRYFRELCKRRSITAAAVVGIAGRSLRKYFPIERCLSDRQRKARFLNLKWTD